MILGIIIRLDALIKVFGSSDAIFMTPTFPLDLYAL